MAFTYKKQAANFLKKGLIYPSLFAAITFQSCNHHKKVYESNCNTGVTFKHVSFTNLIDSIQSYNNQYVEVYGTYKEGRGESALFNDSLFVDHSTGHALWINFSQDCPLYLTGTRIGLFEFNDGKFTQINNKKITVRGKVDVMHKGNSGSYKASIDRISFVKL